MTIDGNKPDYGSIKTIDIPCPNCCIAIRVDENVFEEGKLFRCWSCGQPLKKSKNELITDR